MRLSKVHLATLPPGWPPLCSCRNKFFDCWSKSAQPTISVVSSALIGVIPTVLRPRGGATAALARVPVVHPVSLHRDAFELV